MPAARNILWVSDVKEDVFLKGGTAFTSRTFAYTVGITGSPPDHADRETNALASGVVAARSVGS